MAATSSGLDADQVLIVQQGISALLAAGFHDKTVAELAQRFNVNEAAAGTWRNIHYSENDTKRLPIMQRPSVRGLEVGGLHFGARFDVMDSRTIGSKVWLMLAEDKWVLAKDASIVNCVDTRVWKHSKGPIPEDAFTGQDYPHNGMFTEGYSGTSDICLVSASGDGFWRELNIEMLFRDIATATVFEAAWGGEAHFTTWVAYYAANVVLFAEVRAVRSKGFVITVKPTGRWRLYSNGGRAGPALAEIKGDLGKAQFEECTWLHSNRARLNLVWGTVTFVTPFTFLKTHCQYSVTDCQRLAEDKLQRLLEAWASFSPSEHTYQFAVSYWLIDEAFDAQELSEKSSMLLSKIFLCKGALVLPLDGAIAQAWEKLMASPSVLGPSVVAALAEPGDAGSRALLKLLQLGQVAAPLVGPLARVPRHAEDRVQIAVAEFLEAHGTSTGSARNTSTTQGNWQTLPDMPAERKFFAAVVSEGYVYVLGGSGRGGRLRDVLRLDPSTEAWEPVAPLPGARRYLAAAALGGKLYALGGYDGDRALADVQCFDPSAAGGARPWRCWLRLGAASRP